MPKKFRTKPVEVDAVQWKNTQDSLYEIQEWVGVLFTTRVEPATGVTDPEFTGAVFDILHEVWIPIKTGQWIVQGSKGEFYPCDDEVFHWKYEEVSNVRVSTERVDERL